MFLLGVWWDLSVCLCWDWFILCVFLDLYFVCFWWSFDRSCVSVWVGCCCVCCFCVCWVSCWWFCVLICFWLLLCVWSCCIRWWRYCCCGLIWLWFSWRCVDVWWCCVVFSFWIVFCVYRLSCWVVWVVCRVCCFCFLDWVFVERLF